MRFAQRVHPRVWPLLIAGMVITLGTLGVRAQSDTLHPPAGLTEVSPTMSMPVFQLPAVNGSAVSSTELEGKVVIVRFWATW
jgi:cytochrome oxidase Cu insertion factor (SCO1/SenC/PrrC family)